MDGIKEMKKIDKIVLQLKEKIKKSGIYENAGQHELRKYSGTLGYEDYQLRCKLLSYFNSEIDNLV